MFLCVDLGTSNCKACMVSEGGEIIAQEKRPYRIRLEGKRAEIDPEAVWTVAAETIRALLRASPDDRIQGVGISTLLGYVFLDSSGKPVRPAILYLDSRAEEECQEAITRDDLSPALKRTGRRLTPELLAPQVRWIRTHEGESMHRIHRILGLKDYLVFRLTGELGTDFAHLNYSGIYDLAKGHLDPVLLSWEGLEKENFPPCSYPFQIAGSVRQSASRETGIPTGVPVVRGSTDGTTAMYGGGMAEGGTAVWVSGTTDVCMCLHPHPIPDSQGILSQNTGMVPGTFALGGATGLSGGTLLRLKEVFSVRVEDLIPSLPSIPPGSEGLVFSPGLTGERSPYWSSSARGTILGWGMEHTALHFIRAWVEGSTYRICRILRTLESAEVKIHTLHLGGGGAIWDTVNQVRADILGVPVKRLAQIEGTILGVALFTAVGLGLFPSLSEGTREWIRIDKEYAPDLEKTVFYRELFHRYEERLVTLYGSSTIYQGERFHE